MVLASPGNSIFDAAQLGPDVVGASEIAADSVGDSEVAAHTTTKITLPTSKLSGTLAIGNFADNIITPAKLENGTRGDILYAGASGVFARLGAGSSGTVLKSNGAGSDPSWGSASTSFLVPLELPSGGSDGDQGNFRHVSFVDAATTRGLCTFFMPTGTISSIVFLARSNTGAAGNGVFTFSFSSAADGTVNTNDSAADQVVTDFASTVNFQHVVIPSSAYNGLTQGLPWAVDVTRTGTHGSDDHASTIFGMGILVNL